MKKRTYGYKTISLLFALIYMVSYLTRVNFGAIISEMVQATGIGKNLLSLSLTGSFVTYAAGQVISGILVDRFSPKKMITGGLLLTAGMNILIPLCNSPYTMLVVWCINGFAQSMMWPPIVKMMTGMFNREEYQKAATIVSWGSSVGTMLVYLISPIVILTLDWRWVFFIAGGIAILTTIMWQGFSDTSKSVSVKVAEEKGSIGVLFSPFMIGVMIAIILQGMLKDGVTTWMPSYIMETYHWSSASSVLTGVVLPIFSILCFQAASGLHRKVFRNPLTCAGVFFAAGCVSAGFLFFITGGNVELSVLFSALLTGTMHGVNMMLISMLPRYFDRYGLTGTASGILNACTYLGSAVSTYGVAALSQGIGWRSTILIWIGIAAAGAGICMLCVKGFRRKFY